MTAVRERKTRLVFETDATVRTRGKYREIIVEVGTHGANLRLKGTQTRLPISWEGVYVYAAKIAASRAAAERKAPCECGHPRTNHKKGSRNCRRCLCTSFNKKGTR